MNQPNEHDNVDADVDINIEASASDPSERRFESGYVIRRVPRGKELVEVNWFKKNLMSRKFIVATVLFAAVTIFFGLGLCSFDDWADFCKWIFGIYAVGNAAEHVTETVQRG